MAHRSDLELRAITMYYFENLENTYCTQRSYVGIGNLHQGLTNTKNVAA